MLCARCSLFAFRQLSQGGEVQAAAWLHLGCSSRAQISGFIDEACRNCRASVCLNCCTSSSSKHRQNKSGCHNVELFLFRPIICDKYYVKILLSWDDKIECGHVLTVLTPQVFAVYSHAALASDSSALEIWHVAVTEYFMLAVLRFLSLARNRSIGVASLESRGHGHG